MYLSQLLLRRANPQCSSGRSRSGTALAYIKLLINFVTIAALLKVTNGVELTFELPDNAKECFYEVIEEGKTSTVEFQVGSYKAHVLPPP